MIEGAKQDVVILSGGDSGMNEFFVQPGIASFEALAAPLRRTASAWRRLPSSACRLPVDRTRV
jgi:hypothetical protein